jgi:hypothetical protein
MTTRADTNMYLNSGVISTNVGRYIPAYGKLVYYKIYVLGVPHVACIDGSHLLESLRDMVGGLWT